MKSTTAAAIMSALALLALTASAQAPAPAPASAAAEPTAPAAAKTPSRMKSGSWTPADARACLEFESNLQVIQCAEKFRHMKAPA